MRAHVNNNLKEMPPALGTYHHADALGFINFS